MDLQSIAIDRSATCAFYRRPDEYDCIIFLDYDKKHNEKRRRFLLRFSDASKRDQLRYWFCFGRICIEVALMLPSELDVPLIVTLSPTCKSAEEPTTLFKMLVPIE